MSALRGLKSCGILGIPQASRGEMTEKKQSRRNPAVSRTKEAAPDGDFVKELKKRLVERRDQIRGAINLELNDLRANEGHHLADMEDLASDSLDESTAFQIIEIEQAELEQIEKALGLIEEGEYGKCEECGSAIGVERLRALPFATTCVDCKRDQERKSSRD